MLRHFCSIMQWTFTLMLEILCTLFLHRNNKSLTRHSCLRHMRHFLTESRLPTTEVQHAQLPHWWSHPRGSPGNANTSHQAPGSVAECSVPAIHTLNSSNTQEGSSRPGCLLCQVLLNAEPYLYLYISNTLCHWVSRHWYTKL